MHKAAFKTLKVSAVYEAFDVKPNDLEDFMKNLHEKHVDGLNVSMPYKTEVMQYLAGIDPVAKKIGAVNCIYKKNGKYHGTNYDWKGIIEPLKKITPLKGKKVLLLGAGGAAKAACYGLKKEGAKVKAFDPKAMENAKKSIRGITFSNDAYSAAKGADCLVIVTDWNEFKEMDLKKVKKLMRRPIIIDGRNIYEPDLIKKAGFKYTGVGRR